MSETSNLSKSVNMFLRELVSPQSPEARRQKPKLIHVAANRNQGNQSVSDLTNHPAEPEGCLAEGMTPLPSSPALQNAGRRSGARSRS